MTRAEKVELGLIPIIGALVWQTSSWLPAKVSAGNLLLAASAVLLFQGLIRDLWLLAKKKHSEPQHPPIKAPCMCVESTVGMTGIIAGIFALSFGFGGMVTMSNGAWSLMVIAIMATSFAIKDYVIEWRPWRIRREKDHMNIVFTWKR